jgi:hypothetical protein
VNFPRAKPGGVRPRVCFLYIAQTHQILHSLPIAIALAQGWPDIDVQIATATQEHLDYVRALLETLKVPPIPSRLLPPAWLRDLRLKGAATPPKALMLAANARRLGRYDAVVTPERTTALLRKLGVRDTRLVYTQHGAGYQFASQKALIDTHTGDLVGGAAVEGAGPNNRAIRADSYSVSDKGDRVLFKGRVRTRLTPQQ